MKYVDIYLTDSFIPLAAACDLTLTLIETCERDWAAQYRVEGEEGDLERFMSKLWDPKTVRQVLRDHVKTKKGASK
jgi:hypothetical protein